MERLTKWFGEGENRVAGVADDLEEKYTPEEIIDILLAALAPYEDTGLEPEEIRGTLDHFRKLVQAEQDGRLVVLPCKIGTDVYAVYTPVRGTNSTVVKVGFRYALIHHWGKAVFATREEAKAAQKGGGEG